MTDDERASLNAVVAELRAEVAYLRDQIRWLTTETVPNWPKCVGNGAPVIDARYIREITKP